MLAAQLDQFRQLTSEPAKVTKFMIRGRLEQPERIDH